MSTYETKRSSSTSSKIWSQVKKAAAEHHASVNSAYNSYYGGYASASPSAAASRRASANSAMSVDSTDSPSGVDKLWGKVKKAAKEHHEAVNSAHAAYYGTTYKA